MPSQKKDSELSHNFSDLPQSQQIKMSRMARRLQYGPLNQQAKQSILDRYPNLNQSNSTQQSTRQSEDE